MHVFRRKILTPVSELHVEERRWWDFREPVKKPCWGVRKNLFAQAGVSAAMDRVVNVSSVTW